MSLLGAYLNVKRYIMRPLPLGYAHRADVPQLEQTLPLSPARHMQATMLRTRPVQNVIIDDMPHDYTSAAYNHNAAVASKINRSQAVDNINLIVPKVNEESRIGSIDYEME